jgi:hypothetical protein
MEGIDFCVLEIILFIRRIFMHNGGVTTKT